MPFAPNHLHDFHGGVLALGRAAGQGTAEEGYSTLRMPSTQDSSVPEWVHNTLPDALADYSVDVGQDLIAVATLHASVNFCVYKGQN